MTHDDPPSVRPLTGGLVVPDPLIRLEPDGRRVIVAVLGVQRTVIATVCGGPFFAAVPSRNLFRV